jgi:hypothetical protein
MEEIDTKQKVSLFQPWAATVRRQDRALIGAVGFWASRAFEFLQIRRALRISQLRSATFAVLEIEICGYSL